MNPERFRQIRNLFNAAVERPTEARPAFLQEACQGDADLQDAVGRLLSAHQQTEGVLDQPALLRGDAGRMEGRRIGPYEILREVGRGGMGSVYLAVRTDQVYRKTVAFKVVRPEASSDDVIRRFQQEREIVAGLDHPNIARLLDGGTTPEGLPYFVMEYVDGQPIDVYCDERHLSVAERLRLFRAVCAAVEYAHGRGVAHRDLKPGNILVTAEGTVKLLDFGIAKLLDAQPEAAAANLTRTGLRPMTPEYASPEQVKGDSVGAASDQYSLGVVLYELLTGHRPYRMRSRLIHEVVRVICEEDPTLPSTAVTETVERTIGEKPVSVTPQLISRSRETTPAELRRELSGDLDNILLRTLRKDPRQRYAAVKDFSDDLQRRLDGQPVTAQPQGLIYRASKFLNRHAGWAVAVGLLVIGLANGAVKISQFTAIILSLFLICLTTVFVLVRSEIGSGFARGQLFFWTLIVLAFLGPPLVLQKSSVLDPYIRAFVFLSLPPVVLSLLTALARWPWRRRWAGRLLLDISRPRLAARFILAALAAEGLLLALVIHGQSVNVLPSRPQPEFFGASLKRLLVGQGFLGMWFILLLLTAYLFIMWGQAEICERGILRYGLLTRWRQIESYGWDRPGGGLVILKARSRRIVGPGSGSWKIALPAGRYAEADAILRKQLSEWPVGSAGPSQPVATQ